MCTALDVVEVIFAIFLFSPSTALSTSDDERSAEYHQLKQIFDKLLYEVVDLNQERLNAINRVLMLEEQQLKLDEPEQPRKLRSLGEERDVDPLILFLVNRKNNKIYDNSEILRSLRSVREWSDTSKEGLSIFIPEADIIGSDNKAAEKTEILRVFKSCKKAAARNCRKACVSSSKNVCKSYRCSSRMKKAFKRECKSNCDDRFKD